MSHNIDISVSKMPSQGDTLVIFVSHDGKKKAPTSPKLSKGLSSLLSQAESEELFSGKKKETLFFRSAHVDGHPNVLLTGLGDSKISQAML
jgi:hypothetical protein